MYLLTLYMIVQQATDFKLDMFIDHFWW